MPTIKYCRACSKAVLSGAKTCVYCGVADPASEPAAIATGLVMIAVGIAIVVAIAVMAGRWIMSPTETPTVSREVVPTSPREHIEYLARRAVGAKQLRTVKVRMTPDNWQVTVDFAASDNWTVNMIRRGIVRDMLNCFYVLFTSKHPVGLVTTKAYMPLIDLHGNNIDGMVYEMKMPRHVAVKMHWPNRDQVNAHALGLVEFIHPALLGD